VESCCFIDAAKDVIGIAENNRKDDVWFLRQLLKAHQDKVVEVFTSVLTIAECTHAANNAEKRVRDLFDRLLMSGQNCILVQPTPFIAADARDLRWKHNILLVDRI
jgi:PIN domain